MKPTLVLLSVLLGAGALAAPRPATAQTARELTCESRGDRFSYCRVPTGGRVRLVRQESETPCLLNRTWGFDADGVWVDRGCRGRFSVAGSGPGWESGGNGRRIRCESTGNEYAFCPVPTRGDVRLVRQLSQRSCLPRRTWGFQSDGIWVTDGCRAEFEVGFANVDWSGDSRSITCESDDRRYTRCRVWTYGTVRLARQLSSARCVQGRTWGYDQDGVWVTDGCRGIFAVGTPQGGGGWGQYPEIGRAHV